MTSPRKPPLMSTEVSTATTEELARCVLDYGNQYDAHLMFYSAVELAKRILPTIEPNPGPDKVVSWHCNASQGLAEESLTVKRHMDNARRNFGGEK